RSWPQPTPSRSNPNMAIAVVRPTRGRIAPDGDVSKVPIRPPCEQEGTLLRRHSTPVAEREKNGGTPRAGEGPGWGSRRSRAGSVFDSLCGPTLIVLLGGIRWRRLAC